MSNFIIQTNKLFICTITELQNTEEKEKTLKVVRDIK